MEFNHSAYAEDIFSTRLRQIQTRTDRVFALLFVLQWIFGIICAVSISRITWAAGLPNVHHHVWAAIVLGGLLSVYPIVLAWLRPARTSTRMTIAVAQMLYSALLIHLTGGRIETHFHVFGSLAVMAFYRDWRVFIPATVVIGTDHLIRGIFWPESVFGVLVASPWRAFEHAGWVLFEDVFLVWGCVTSVREMRQSAVAHANLEESRLAVEDIVECRTHQLRERTESLEAEINRRKTLEQQLSQAQKLESIGQLAAGIAHEINTPMQFVGDNIQFLDDCCNRLFEVVDAYEKNLTGGDQPKSWQERRDELDDVMRRNQFDRIREHVPQAIAESVEGIGRVINIVRAMKEFSHPGRELKVGVDLNNAVQSTVTITRNRWKYVAEMELDLDPDLPTVSCTPAEINQVLLNLIVNAADAVMEKVGDNTGEKGTITVRTRAADGSIWVEVEDTGCGVPEEIRNRIFDPFFTTKEAGKGTGQGLAICYDLIVNKHGGTLDVESSPGQGSTFRFSILQQPFDATLDTLVETSIEANLDEAELFVTASSR